MFSSRTRWDRRENRISAALRARREAGLEILDLTETNPTKAGLRAPEDILAPLSRREGLGYSPEPKGMAAARESIAALLGRSGVTASAERIVLTASTSEAYALVFKLLCDPGDSILVPRPSYPLFEFLATLESVKVESYPLSYDGRWHVDFSTLSRSIHPKTRAIVLVHPNNPT